jgi:hypothetical protein
MKNKKKLWNPISNQPDVNGEIKKKDKKKSKSIYANLLNLWLNSLDWDNFIKNYKALFSISLILKIKKTI